MDELIAELEQAEGRGATISAFLLVGSKIEVPEDFRRHVSQAVRSKSDTRAMGYLFLAALTLVPETDGGNFAGFLHATFWQGSIGDIPNDGLALALCIAALKARA